MSTEATASATAPSADSRLSLPKLLREWFVQYNPLFLLSVCSLLFGVFLISDHLDKANSAYAETWLTLIMEGYQFLLLAGAAALFKIARQHRAAVILGLIQLLLLGDVTFQTEQAATLGISGLILSGLWLTLFGLKILVLSQIFGLRLSPSAWAILVLGAAFVAFFPHLRYQHVLSKQSASQLILLFGFALTVWVVYGKPTIESAAALSPCVKRALEILAKAAWVAFGAFYVYHAACWSVANRLPIGILHVTTLALLFGVFARSEKLRWMALAFAALLALADPSQLSPTLAMAALLFLLDALCLRSTRLFVGAITAGYLALATAGWATELMPLTFWPFGLLPTTLLLLLAWRQRALLPVAALAAHAFCWLGCGRDLPAPAGSPLQWGVALLLGAFAALVGGVLFSWLVGARARRARAGG